MTQTQPPRGRRSLRLQDYDYAEGGAYFVTICTQDRECRFGEVIAGSMCLNESGQQIAMLWEGIASRYHGLEIDRPLYKDKPEGVIRHCQADRDGSMIGRSLSRQPVEPP